MSFDILLDSSLAKLERGGERNVSHNFTVKFHSPIELGSGNYGNDMSIYRVVISMHENYELDFSQGAFAELLGYEKKS